MYLFNENSLGVILNIELHIMCVCVYVFILCMYVCVYMY